MDCFVPRNDGIPPPLRPPPASAHSPCFCTLTPPLHTHPATAHTPRHGTLTPPRHTHPATAHTPRHGTLTPPRHTHPATAHPPRHCTLTQDQLTAVTARSEATRQSMARKLLKFESTAFLKPMPTVISAIYLTPDAVQVNTAKLMGRQSPGLRLAHLPRVHRMQPAQPSRGGQLSISSSLKPQPLHGMVFLTEGPAHEQPR